MTARHVHFVGFRGDEYGRAQRVFGPPDFVHMTHDRRMYGDVGDGDIIVFGPKASPDKISEFTRFGKMRLRKVSYKVPFSHMDGDQKRRTREAWAAFNVRFPRVSQECVRLTTSGIGESYICLGYEKHQR